MLSLGIWHRCVSLYMVYHLPEYLPGSRKLKLLEEKLFFQRDYPRPDSSPRWGWTCQVHTSYRALLLLQHSCIWKGALGKFCLLILIEIKIFMCLSKLWPEIPPESLAHNPAHPVKWEWNSQQPWLPVASWIFIALSHTKHIFFFSEKRKKHSRSLCTAHFFPLKTVRCDQSITLFNKAFVNLSRPCLHYSLQWHPEAGAARCLVPAWVSLSSWDQCSLSQLGLIAADAVRCAVGCKVGNRLPTPCALNKHKRGPVASKGRGFGWESQGICRGNSGGAGFAQGPGAFLVQHCWRQCLMRSVSDPHLYFLLSSQGLASSLSFCYSSCYWSGCLSNFPSPWKTHPWAHL